MLNVEYKSSGQVRSAAINHLQIAPGNQANKVWYYLERGRETKGGSLVLVTCLVVIKK